MHFIVEAIVTFSNGPTLPDGVDRVQLIASPYLNVWYGRFTESAVREEKYIGNSRSSVRVIHPPGELHVWSRERWKAGCLNIEFPTDSDLVQVFYPVPTILEKRLERVVRAAVAAFDTANDSYTEVWRSQTSFHWIDAAGKKYRPIYSHVSMQSNPVTQIDEEAARLFEQMFELWNGPQSESLRAAYSVARLNTEHFTPATRIVFTWSLIERLCRQIHRGKRLRHRQIRDMAVEVCRSQLRDDEFPVVAFDRLEGALQSAYDLRNGLSHGEPARSFDIDFAALARAVTLIARRLCQGGHRGA